MQYVDQIDLSESYEYWLVGFYGISAILGYLIPTLFICIH